MSTSNEIVLKGDVLLYEEAKVAAGQTLYPGMLVELNGSGELVAITSAGKNVPTRVVLVNTWAGKTKTDAWTAGEVAKYVIPQAGWLINLRCLSGEDIDIGEQVIVGTTGRGIATTGSPAKTLGVSEEDSGGALAADGYLAVRIG